MLSFQRRRRGLGGDEADEGKQVGHARLITPPAVPDSHQYAGWSVAGWVRGPWSPPVDGPLDGVIR